jgi:septal ring factor EnvC (AmiA/AmiB activator)
MPYVALCTLLLHMCICGSSFPPKPAAASILNLHTEGSRTAADLDAKTNAEEVERLRKATSTHVSAIRRHKVRQSQLEDALISLKQDLETSQDALSEAEAAVTQARTKAAAADLRASAAEAAERSARMELAGAVDEVASVRDESRAALAHMQDTSCEALRSAEAATAAHVQHLTAHVSSLEAENKRLQQLNQQFENRQASGVEEGRKEDVGKNVVAELQRRNHKLQMALAEQHATGETCPNAEVRTTLRENRYIGGALEAPELS